MTEEAASIYRRHTGRKELPDAPCREGWLVVGRRGGKSRISAVVSVFLAAFRNYSQILAPGEKGTVMLLAADRRQARVLMRYVGGLLDGVPMLAAMVVGRTSESVTLSNGIIIEIHTASFRAVRGYTVVAAICDEIAFWHSEESANPDFEILNALRPAMATVPSAVLLCISSPYARRGSLWEAYRGHYGREGDPVLVWQSDTLSMNPSVNPKIISDAYDQDEAAADAEYGGNFRRDVEAFVSPEAVERVVVPGRTEISPTKGVQYVAFVDPSGGSQDSMTLAIAHQERGTHVLDLLLEEKPPLAPETVVERFSDVLRSYGITRVQGDRYAGEWPRDQFRKHGVAYEVSERPKSDLYQALLPLITSGKVELLDMRRLNRQLLGLERTTSRAGRDSISHLPGGHDDVVNAAAGALVNARPRRRWFEGFGATTDEDSEQRTDSKRDERRRTEVESRNAALARDGWRSADALR
jgi:hypothetical protein